MACASFLPIGCTAEQDASADAAPTPVLVEKPVALAEQMVAASPDLNGQIQNLIDEGKTQRVSLPQDVAVYLLYWTAFANGDGVVSFRNDPYGWDKLLAQKIEASSSRADPTAAPAPASIASKD